MPFKNLHLYKKAVPLFICFLVCIFHFTKSYAQAVCPVNIGFELGGLQNWQCFAGTTYSSGTSNYITVTPTAPLSGIHQIVKSSNQQDPFAPIKLSAPDGSDYLVKLGNSGVGQQAERISYTFNVPADQKDFVITYQYAVVLEDPGHAAWEQPRFTAKVFDITTNSYISCGSFEYVATANLPGFKKIGGVIYKDWTPASINLYGYQGHRLRLEFSTADCTQSGHFGYAYVDVNNTCSSLITGNNFCPEFPTFTLTGPAGFDKYNWYNADRSKLLGTGLNLVLPTANNNNKTIILDLVPYTGFGCNYTTSVVTKANVPVTLIVKDPVAVCFPSTVDITTPGVITNQKAGLTYTFWTDAAATKPVLKPDAIGVSGTYYIKAESSAACYVVSPVSVIISALPIVTIVNPPTVCLSSPVDITLTGITAGSSAGLTFTYWADANATQAIPIPSIIKTAGTYYIKGTNVGGCFVIKPVLVTYFDLPVVKISTPPAVCFPSTIDITKPHVTAGSDAGLAFTYWLNANCTQPLLSPDKITKTGQYYIKATNSNGCEMVKPVIATINPLPDLKITNPFEVCYPETVNLTHASITNGSVNVDKLTYWLDVGATKPITKPTAYTDSGIVYIKAISIYGCEMIKPVLVTVHKLPILTISNPKKVYEPTTIDVTPASTTKGSIGVAKLTYWYNEAATDPISDPKKINQSGIYYIKGENIYGCSVIKPVELTIAPKPDILVPKAFTPLQLQNNKLYPFLVGIKTFESFKVYNRWGVLVFQTNTAEPSSGWDGIYKSQVQFLDVFTWYAEGTDFVGNAVRRSGNTVLLK